MRRSAAPSAFGTGKKLRFVVPYASVLTASVKETQYRPNNSNEQFGAGAFGNTARTSQSTERTRSTGDVLKLLSNPCAAESGGAEDSSPSNIFTEVGTPCQPSSPVMRNITSLQGAECTRSTGDVLKLLSNSTESPEAKDSSHPLNIKNELGQTLNMAETDASPYLAEQPESDDRNDIFSKNTGMNTVTKSCQENLIFCSDSSGQRFPTPVSDSQASALYYSVVWCKRSMKKHKKWEGDAVLIIEGRSAVLKDMEGKEIGRAIGYKTKEVNDLEDGSTFYIGGKECEIQNEISCEEYLSGKCFHVLADKNSAAPPLGSMNV